MKEARSALPPQKDGFKGYGRGMLFRGTASWHGEAGEGQRLQREKGISVGELSAADLTLREAWRGSSLLYYSDRALRFYTQPQCSVPTAQLLLDVFHQ